MASTKSINLISASSQYLSITDGDQTGLDLGSDFTIEGDYKVASTPTSGQAFEMFDKYLSTGNQRSYRFFYQNSGGTMQIIIGTSSNGEAGGVKNHAFNYTLSTRTWYHIAMTYDLSAGTAELFINSSSQGTVASGNTSIHNGTAEVNLGSVNDGTALYWNGKMFNTRVWGDIRTDQEILDNYQAYVASDADNLISNWQYNDDLLDETTNNNDLTNNGTALFNADIPAWAAVTTDIKSVNSLAKASVKSIKGLAIADVKSINGLE